MEDYARTDVLWFAFGPLLVMIPPVALPTFGVLVLFALLAVMAYRRTP